MSNVDTRQAIADALSTVSGIHGYPRRPNVTGEGDAWPQWRGSERAGGAAFMNTWAVLIVLPANVDSADAFADEHSEALADALRPVLFVESFQPAKIEAAGNDVYALMITGRCE